MALGLWPKAAMFLRSFSIQATWNYRTLLGAGFAYMMLPALRRIYAGDADGLRAALTRHTGVFNSHPYFAGVAAGAVTRLEMEGRDPAQIERFKAAVRGSLGSVGDQLVWAGWRPLCALFALGLLYMRAPWWVVCGAFLVVYNIGHVLLRWWSFHIGFKHGTAVGEQLRRAHFPHLQRFITTVGAFLLGLVLPLTVRGRAMELPLPTLWVGLAALGVFVGLRFGNTVRTPVIAMLTVFALAGFIAGLL